MGVSFSDWLGYDIIRARFDYILRALSGAKAFRFSSRERTSTTTLRMSNFASMRKHFNLRAGLVLFAQKKGSVYKIKIYEIELDNRYVDFSIVRWAPFVHAIDEAQNAICEIHTNPKLKHHIGGGYYISVSANFKCVEIR